MLTLTFSYPSIIINAKELVVAGKLVPTHFYLETEGALNVEDITDST